MVQSNKENTTNQITTDDLALSAYMKMKGFPLVRFASRGQKYWFTFQLNGKDPHQIKMEFINSDFLKFYNEIKNLKKLF